MFETDLFPKQILISDALNHSRRRRCTYSSRFDSQALLQQLQQDLLACNARLAADKEHRQRGGAGGEAGGDADADGGGSGRRAGRELLDEKEYLEAELEFRGMEVPTRSIGEGGQGGVQGHRGAYPQNRRGRARWRSGAWSCLTLSLSE